MSKLDRWNERYAKPHYHFGTQPSEFLKSQAHLLKSGMKALSVADGEGRNGIWLAERGLNVHTFDLSPNGVAKARALAAQRGVTLRIEQGDLHGWSWPDAIYDLVVAIFIQFSPAAERDRAFAGMKRALRPGGLLLMEGYRLEQANCESGGPKEVEQLYSRALLEEAFGDFSSLNIREHDTELHEGDRHISLAAVIELVGRK